MTIILLCFHCLLHSYYFYYRNTQELFLAFQLFSKVIEAPMSQLNKVYCNFHPHELITNFCTQPECLTALCASCICTHTQQHVSQNSAPIYENIRNTYKNLHQKIRGKIDNLENLRSRIGKVEKKTFDKRNVLREVVMKAREDCHRYVDEYFDTKLDYYVKEMEAHERKTGLHCESRLNTLESSLTREISVLMSAAQDASLDGFIQAMPRVRNVLDDANKINSELEKEVIDNQNFSTTIEYKRELIPQLAEQLNKVIEMTITSEGQRPEKRNQDATKSIIYENTHQILRSSSADHFNKNRNQSPSVRPPYNQNKPQFNNSLKPVPNINGRYPQNTHQSYMKNNNQFQPKTFLNEIPFKQNTAQKSNENSNLRVPMKQSIQPVLTEGNTLSNPLNSQKLSFSRVEPHYPHHSNNIKQNCNQEHNPYGNKDFVKMSLSKKPKKAGLKVVNQEGSYPE